MADAFSNNLPKSVKIWYARAIAGAICSDGVVDDDELKFLAKAVEFLDTKEEVYELMDQVRTRNVPELTSLQGYDKAQCFRMMATIVAIVANDGILSKGEAIFVRDMAKKMGFPIHFSKRVIEWAQKSAEVRKEYAALRKMALSGDIS